MRHLLQHRLVGALLPQGVLAPAADPAPPPAVVEVEVRQAHRGDVRVRLEVHLPWEEDEKAFSGTCSPSSLMMAISL